MAEPDNLVLELLRELRSDLRRVETKVDSSRTGSEARFEELETKLDGLTHAVIAGFGSLVHELDDLKTRVGRLEREQA